MNKQKQIEEMAKEIEKAKKHIWASVMPQADYEDYLWHSRAIAEHLMLQGYRNADEVRKETAKEIYERLIELSENPCNNREEIYKEVFGKYGVEVEE